MSGLSVLYLFFSAWVWCREIKRNWQSSKQLQLTWLTYQVVAINSASSHSYTHYTTLTATYFLHLTAFVQTFCFFSFVNFMPDVGFDLLTCWFSIILTDGFCIKAKCGYSYILCELVMIRRGCCNWYNSDHEKQTSFLSWSIKLLPQTPLLS